MHKQQLQCRTALAVVAQGTIYTFFNRLVDVSVVKNDGWIFSFNPISDASGLVLDVAPPGRLSFLSCQLRPKHPHRLFS